MSCAISEHAYSSAIYIIIFQAAVNMHFQFQLLFLRLPFLTLVIGCILTSSLLAPISRSLPPRTLALPSSALTDLPSIRNGSVVDYDVTLTDLNAQPICDGARFGRDISRTSCNDALSRLVIPRGDPMMHFGQRGHWSEYENKLPIRWLSCKPWIPCHSFSGSRVCLLICSGAYR